ncbi:MAG: diguanylate cyclase, partial [Proteobacteria bacterium]
MPFGQDSHDLSWLAGGGEMGELIRAFDWSKTPLGQIAGWPQSLKTSVSLCLSSTFPILLAWGPDDIQIYNDAYRPICGPKHPEALGMAFKVCWATALPVVGGAFDRAHAGEGAYIKDQQMMLDRFGYLEEAFMTFSFSPIRVETGEVGGIFHPITETTEATLNARRTKAIREIGLAIGTAKSLDDLVEQAVAKQADVSFDLPYFLFYELNEAGDAATLLGSSGLAQCHALAP